MSCLRGQQLLLTLCRVVVVLAWADIAECTRLIGLCTRDAVLAALKLKLSERTNMRESRVAALKAAAVKIKLRSVTFMEQSINFNVREH